MLFDGYDVTLENAGFNWKINVKSPDGIRFSAGLQCQGLNEAMAYEVWRNNYKSFTVELENITLQSGAKV